MFSCKLFSLLLVLPNFGIALPSFAEKVSDHVHVAINDHLIVFTRNRDGAFHFVFTSSETTTMILDLPFTSVHTEIVSSLAIPTEISSFNQTDLLFIGGPRNSSERILYHVKLQINERDETLSVIDWRNLSISSLSSVGIECALGIHPLGTYAVILGDRGGYIYDMKESNGQYWSSWAGSTDSFYPKAISVTMDNFVLVGANVQLIDTIVPALFTASLDVQNMTETLESFNIMHFIDSTSIRAPISITTRGKVEEGRFVLVVGFPSEDAVNILILEHGEFFASRRHQSEEKNINFGQAVILTNNETYGVLSSTLATSPWSTGRVQVWSASRDDQSTQPLDAR